jgi:hypothetical protein
MLGLAAAGSATAVPVESASDIASLATLGAEPSLRQALQTATWPDDMVRLADAYLQQFAQHAQAAEAAETRRSAAITARLLREGDVQLFRSAFVPPAALGLAQQDLRQAALGDAAAALRVAMKLQGSDARGAGSSPVGWLQLATELGNERAAYELALHFRRQAQPLLASVYEQRAATLGYRALPALGHARK